GGWSPTETVVPGLLSLQLGNSLAGGRSPAGSGRPGFVAGMPQRWRGTCRNSIRIGEGRLGATDCLTRGSEITDGPRDPAAAGGDPAAAGGDPAARERCSAGFAPAKIAERPCRAAGASASAGMKGGGPLHPWSLRLVDQQEQIIAVEEAAVVRIEPALVGRAHFRPWADWNPLTIR